ncbi:hypothetical protein S40285_03726 [Stachybotrys chlorohalonatus IBT 40285]|uniref:Deacetylase sirtuin-type domain-containing protein n=1 Tax=Stachybotrys chlorohalonatus (strain IBT 40285) TaxID=1283841 RepID=A0A084QQ05_STAC4|nr:hypothetical protein S40285_03726 [Stachybotrys chlorohalonata IBT 40285]
MAHQTALDSEALADFHKTLLQSKRIVALLGAGLSASSGVPTFANFRSQGPWRNYVADQFSTSAAFRHDPGLVWQYYSHMRHRALTADPNPAHYALAELARQLPGFITLTQNIDNLSQKAGHPAHQLRELHGNIFNLRCYDDVHCGYKEKGNFQDPITPALEVKDETKTKAVSEVASDAVVSPNIVKATPWLVKAIAQKNKQILGDGYQETQPTRVDQAPLKSSKGESLESRLSMVPEPSGLAQEDLPRCPNCSSNLLRPDIVWFGEPLPAELVEEVDAIFSGPQPIDLCLVIGTSSTVWPAAGFPELARKKGARIAVVNIDTKNVKSMRPGIDWVFECDASIAVPELLRPLVADLNKETSTAAL